MNETWNDQCCLVWFLLCFSIKTLNYLSSKKLGCNGRSSSSITRCVWFKKARMENARFYVDDGEILQNYKERKNLGFWPLWVKLMEKLWWKQNLQGQYSRTCEKTKTTKKNISSVARKHKRPAISVHTVLTCQFCRIKYFFFQKLFLNHFIPVFVNFSLSIMRRKWVK